METFVLKQVEDWTLRADVFRPDDQVVRPVVVWIHGGALIMGSRTGINPRHLERFLAAGFAVVSIEYRLAPENPLPAIADDIRDAVGWVRTEGARVAHLDPERIAVAGNSAGGYLTLLSGTLLEPRPRALVSFYGYGDIVGDWYSRPDPFYSRQPAVPENEARAAVGGRPPEDLVDLPDAARGRFYLWCRQHGAWPREVVGADPDTEPEAFVPWCPVDQVTAEFPPTFLLHGDDDTDVPWEQSAKMAEALAAAGVEHRFVTIPVGGHGFDYAMADQPVVEDALEQVVEFLSRHLGLSPPG